jgi:hypothetical protein
MTYDDVKDRLQTGDIVLFNSDFESSKVIELLTGYPFSHSAMVVRNADGTLSMWEETPFNELPCQLDQESHAGARLVDLHTVTQEYAKNTFFQTTFRLLDIDRTSAFWTHALSGLQTSFQQWNKWPFPSDPIMALQYLLGKHQNIFDSSAPMFCSDLVARTYMQMGLLPMNPVPTSYAPGDFSNLNSKLQLLQGSLTDQLTIEWPQAALAELPAMKNKFTMTREERGNPPQVSAASGAAS